jgi:hypothetical protein
MNAVIYEGGTLLVGRLDALDAGGAGRDWSSGRFVGRFFGSDRAF